jgi:hypothetical protein
MKRHVESWSIEKIYKMRAKISFPEYQRQPNLWTTEKKSLLIDSILRDIDIPKLYFNQTKDRSYEVVDGQQRLWAIWEFLDNEYEHQGTGNSFSQLRTERAAALRTYELQVTVFDDADDDYLRELFVRLQLGLLLVTGEKLHASTGAMKEFVFARLPDQPFITALTISTRRYAKSTLCAQMSINSFSRAKLGVFSRTRYEDLAFFFKEYESPAGEDLMFFRKQTKVITTVLDELNELFGTRAGELSNRSYILSLYLFFEEFRKSFDGKTKAAFVKFVFDLWRRLREEISAGIDRKNRELYTFETMLSSAPGERYQIERRHAKLKEYFDYYQRTKRIKGDAKA